MTARLLDGKTIGATIRADVAIRAAKLAERGRPPLLVAIAAGDNPSQRLYAERQQQACEDANIGYQLVTLPGSATQGQIIEAIRDANANPAVTGVMLHQPLPAGVDGSACQGAIDPAKDVEAVHPASVGKLAAGVAAPGEMPADVLAPCTAAAVLELIVSSGVNLVGAEAVIVGASEIVGKPAAWLLLRSKSTVTVCHRYTKDLHAHTRRADVLVVAVGYPNLIGKEDVKRGAVVIDVGINRVTTYDGKAKTVGDVDADVAQIAGHLTPVPGGVGPVTVAMLLRNTVLCAERQL